jgi:hypothetical protein
MRTRREALAAGLALAGAVGLAGGFTQDITTPVSNQDDNSDSKAEDRPPDDDYDLPPEYINVEEYGAEGDGKTDDSDAIQAAIEAAEPGQTVFLPETSASYLLSFKKDKKYGDDVINLTADSGLDDVTVLGERAVQGAQTLQVEEGSYSTATKNTILKITPNEVITGFTLQNLTIDGARPEGDKPASLGGQEALTGISVDHGAGGGHDITLKDILIRDCSASGLRFAESGVTCRRVTSRGHGRHGFNPVAADTTVDPGFVGESIKAVDCDGTGIDHRRGTARLTDVYTKNNRSGNKWKHHVERLEVENHHSVDDLNHGWRSNHTGGNGGTVPPKQEIRLKDVYVENSSKTGIRVSGSDTDIVCDLDNVEVRNTKIESPESGAGVRILRDVEMANPGSGELVVVETRNGVGVRVFQADININTYNHLNNDRGALALFSGAVFRSNSKVEADPGPNIFLTPLQNEVGAFTEVHPTSKLPSEAR